MSKFVLTVVDDPDFRTIIRDWDEVPNCVEIVYEEHRGEEGWFEVSSVPAFNLHDIDTLIKRLKTAKDILEEDDDNL